MDDPILDSTVISEQEGMFLTQISNLFPDLRQQFLAAAKIYLKGIKKRRIDFEKFNAITEGQHGLTTFLAIGMMINYEYADVLKPETQAVALPTAVGSLDELFERAKEAFAASVAGVPTHVPGNIVAVRYLFQFSNDPALCYLIVGLTDHDSLRQIEHAFKNVLFADRDYGAAEKVLHDKISERVKNTIAEERAA